MAIVKRYDDDAMLEAAERADQLLDEGDWTTRGRNHPTRAGIDHRATDVSRRCVMVRTAIAALSVCIVAGGTLALAQDELESSISGTVTSIDSQSRTVTLQDGKAYIMSERADIGSLQTGSKLNLTCDKQGTNCMIVTSSDNKNERGPESTTQPSAGGDGSSGSGN
jgi:ferric-dicitrate binding protein FerR (iron transport regulator)